MRKLINAIVLLVIISGAASGQSTRIRPPQPNYPQYGSYSRQLAVYENAQRRIDELDRERYRRFRAEVRNNLPRQQTRVVVTRRGATYTYGDALTAWRNRRCSAQPHGRSTSCYRGN